MTEHACATLDAFAILDHCHQHILEKLAVLEGVAGELKKDPDFTDARLARLCDVLTFLDTAIPVHSADEEESLFPRMRRHPNFADVSGAPMDQMEAEHGDHREIVAALKRDIMKRDADAVARDARRVVDEYATHIHKETEILYPMAKQLVGDPGSVTAMTDEMHARRRKLGLGGC